jgi:hypothetical protein
LVSKACVAEIDEYVRLLSYRMSQQGGVVRFAGRSTCRLVVTPSTVDGADIEGPPSGEGQGC